MLNETKTTDRNGVALSRYFLHSIFFKGTSQDVREITAVISDNEEEQNFLRFVCDMTNAAKPVQREILAPLPPADIEAFTAAFDRAFFDNEALCIEENLKDFTADPANLFANDCGLLCYAASLDEI